MQINNNQFMKNQISKAVNISDLKDGDVFRAEVLDIKQNETTLKLLGTNAILNARTLKIIGLKIGEIVNFKVSSNSDNKLVIEPVFNDEKNAQSEIVENTLRNSELPNNNVSSEIVKKMVENSLPIYKEKLALIYDLIKQNPKLDMDKLLILLNNNVAITDSNIDTLNRLIEDKEHINTKTDKMIRLTEELVNNFRNPEVSDKAREAVADVLLNSKTKFNEKTLKLFEANKSIVDIAAINDFEKAIKSLNLNAEERLDFVKLLYSGKDMNDKSILKDFIKEDIFSLIPLLNNKFKMKLENNNIKNINEAHKEIYELATRLNNIISENPNIDKTAVNTTNDIKQKIEFMNQILQYDSYIQLPLKLEKNDINSELYILKNKKKKINSRDMTALLCLDLSKLGYTEVLINKSMSNISCKFRLEDYKSKEEFSKNINDLKLKLSGLGYNLINVAYEELDRKTTLANKNELVPDDGDDGKIMSFDIRV